VLFFNFYSHAPFPPSLRLTSQVKAGLPVVTAEVGDTWIWGCAQDPRKMQQLRAMMRARALYGERLNGTDTLPSASDDFYNRENSNTREATTTATIEEAEADAAYDFSREMLKGSEHTW
jgi:hypothetical protein